MDFSYGILYNSESARITDSYCSVALVQNSFLSLLKICKILTYCFLKIETIVWLHLTQDLCGFQFHRIQTMDNTDQRCYKCQTFSVMVIMYQILEMRQALCEEIILPWQPLPVLMVRSLSAHSFESLYMNGTDYVIHCCRGITMAITFIYSVPTQ